MGKSSYSFLSAFACTTRTAAWACLLFVLYYFPLVQPAFEYIRTYFYAAAKCDKLLKSLEAGVVATCSDSMEILVVLAIQIGCFVHSDCLALGLAVVLAECDYC